ncbi:MAG TPA: SDR family NAD(P)-dependent oxidoreductase [Gemmatimonadales bacterium]
MSAALVTGASRGIGRAIALRLAASHDIVAVARSTSDLDELARTIAEGGGRCRTIPLDLTDGSAVRYALSGVAVDVLVNNAGVGVMKPLLEMEPGEWARMMDVNVNALYHVTRAVLPGMIERGRGHVVNIGSLAGRSSFAGGTGYTGSKHFLVGFSESLMLEVRDRGVKVSVVMPGSVNTSFGGGAERDKSWALQAEDVAEAVAHVIDTPPHVLVSRVEMRPRSPQK